MYAQQNWREALWAEIEQPWDLIVIGGGITGAGILREAARAGLRALLVEQADFAGGTSSWSSKLVHGGLRYLAAGQWRLTLESVRERQALMAAAPGLVWPLEFLLPMYAGAKPGRLAMRAALSAYDLMARRRQARFLGAGAMAWRMPYLMADKLSGAFAYPDAGTDDSRLVLRVLGEALLDGARAANYCAVESLVHEGDRVAGVRLYDKILDRRAEVHATAVINATGPWGDSLRAEVGGESRLRPLRGSHLVFDFARLPVAQAVTLFHPEDARPLFAFPWEGATVFGTTDLDQPNWPAASARMSPGEGAYLVDALAHYFPSLGLGVNDALCSYAGVRPVVAGGAANPSEESRESAVWCERGLVTVTGGKLTTYRVTALEALNQLRQQLPALAKLDARAPILQRAGGDRLAGRYGASAASLRAAWPAELQAPVAGSVYSRAELRWALRHEAVERLGDLMLRRTRMGLLLPHGGAGALGAIGALCREELGWDAERWRRERDGYLDHWRQAHSAA